MAEPDGLRLLGIDIGGTRSRARLCTGGQLTAESHGPSASLPAAGRDRARAALTALLDDLKLDETQKLDAVCAGSAGLSVPGAREFLHGQLAPLTRDGQVTIVTDIQLVLPAAGLAEGVAVICGTGSVAVGSRQGRTVQIGGWGFLLGDEGGGYWVVREALRVLLDRRDHGAPPGPLGDRLLAATGAADLAALRQLVYEQPHRPSGWARHAGLVLDSADPAAAAIAARAAGAVAGLAATAAGELDPADSLPVVLAGGLLGNPAFRDSACQAVADALPRAEVSVLADEPVAGAIRLARLTLQPGAGPS
jgi:N-acetylglucosamine kinase-like BadF-type ATPase